MIGIGKRMSEGDNYEEDFKAPQSPTETLPDVVKEKVKRLTLEEHLIHADKAPQSEGDHMDSDNTKKKKKLKKKKVLKTLLGLDK